MDKNFYTEKNTYMGKKLCHDLSAEIGVTIGIPVYNEQDRIERAIRSAVGQCDRLTVSDNASNDGTELICRRLLLEFPNMEYHRHETNLGAFENLRSLFARATSTYFMFLGSHDHLSPGLVAGLRDVLEKDTQTVLSAGGLFFDYEGFNLKEAEEDSRFNHWKGGEKDDPQLRVRAFLFADANLPWAMYGLFRVSVCKELFLQALPMNGFDLVFLAKIAGRGKIVMSRDARYYAWVRPGTDSRTSYIKRIVGDGTSDVTQRSMRNTTRMAIYDVLNDSEGPTTLRAKILLRYEAMARFGVFRYPGFDAIFYLLYLPAKVAITMRRTRRSIMRLSGIRYRS